MNSIASPDEIETLTIDVLENINKKEIRNLILSYLELNDIKYSNEDNIYYIYMEESKKYQIFVYKNSYDFMTYELFEAFYENDENSFIDLIISKEFFLIYKNQCLYYFQKVDYNIDESDLKKYILSSLNISIDRVFKDENFEILKKSFRSKKSKLTLLKQNSNKSFFIYCFYLLIITICFFIYYSYDSINNEKKQSYNAVLKQQKIEQEKIKYKYFDKSTQIEEFYKNIKKYKLKLLQFSFNKKSAKLTFTSSKKKDIYDFLSRYKNSLINSNISIDTQRKLYECSADIKIN